MFIFKRIADLSRVDHARIQELVPFLEEMGSGFTIARLKDKVMEAGVWGKDLDESQVFHRVRRCMEHLIKIDYMKPDAQTHNWYLPNLELIAEDKKQAQRDLAKKLKNADANVAWMIGSGSILAALDGEGVKHGETKSKAKADAPLGRYSRKKPGAPSK